MSGKRSARHNQGAFFTILLVPSYSSGKTRGIRISRRFLGFTAALAVVVVLTLGVLYVRAHTLDGMVRDVSGDLLRSKEDYETLRRRSDEESARLRQQSERLRELMDKERESSELLSEEEKLEYERRLDYYEQRMLEILEKLQELEKAKDEIYSQLSEIYYLPARGENEALALSDLTLEIPAGEDDETFESMGYIYDVLEAEIDNQLVSYSELLDELARAKPYAESYPSGWPLSGVVTSEFGERGGSEHTGIDIGVPTGSAVRVTGGGTVTFSGEKSAYGFLVIVSHGMGVETYYAHCSELLVAEGDRVESGQLIALSGNTGRSSGPHLHYEVRLGGNAVNPRRFL